VSDAIEQEQTLHQRSAKAGASGSQEPVPTMPQPGKVNSVQTGLDGSFTMKGVKPGVYYVIAEMPGYLSPLAGLSVEDRQHPTTSVTDLMAKALKSVTVEAGRTAVVNVGLERGAAVSGTVSFDDGSPAAGIQIKVQREKDDGSWETVELSAMSNMFGSNITTNDLGQYRIAGLAAGHYVIEAEFSLQNLAMTGFLGQAVGWEVRPQYSLSFFTGGSTRARADAVFALTKGEARMGEDLVIPLSKLHSISGNVVAAGDGRPLGGIVQLLYADDKKSMVSTGVNAANGEFRFAFVPEGHFILKVIARDPQTMPALSADPDASDADVMAEDPEYVQMFSTSKHVYGALEQSLDVRDDMDAMVLAVPDASASPAAQNSATSQ
jgi:hypothetical protein